MRGEGDSSPSTPAPVPADAGSAPVAAGAGSALVAAGAGSAPAAAEPGSAPVVAGDEQQHDSITVECTPGDLRLNGMTAFAYTDSFTGKVYCRVACRFVLLFCGCQKVNH